MGLLFSTPVNPDNVALRFSQSQRFIDLVQYAKDKNVKLSMQGRTTVIEIVTYYNETTWRWEDEGAEDFVYDCLFRQINVYAK